MINNTFNMWVVLRGTMKRFPSILQSKLSDIVLSEGKNGAT
jgi:hypothetical protein